MCGGRMSLRKLMQKAGLRTGAVLFLVLVAGIPASSETKIEFQAVIGRTGNLFFDSSSFSDTYSSARASIRFCPFSTLEVQLQNKYTYYAEEFGLSGFLGDIGITFIPTSDRSPFTTYIKGNFNSRTYRKDYRSYNVDNYDLSVSFGYSLSDASQLRAGFTFNSASYTNEESDDSGEELIRTTFDNSADNKSFEVFTGANITFPGSNAFDIELGYAFMNLEYVEPPEDRLFLNPNMDSLLEGTLRSFYISPRFSRSIGSKFGINITYTYRSFEDTENMVIPGISTEFLSPWAAVYEGQTITLSIKAFIIPSFIVTSGAGYWEKTYLKTEVENDDPRPFQPPYVVGDREDDQWKAYLSIQRPFSFKTGFFFEPAAQLEYTDNESSSDRYTYDNLSAYVGITVRM